jgi:hypothetical protein
MNEGETSRLDGNESSSSSGSNVKANRTRFCGRRLCNAAVDNTLDESDETGDKADFNGEIVRTGSTVDNESASNISIIVIGKTKSYLKLTS